MDLYCTAEGHRLHYIASHQADIRADCYKGVQDAVRLSDVSRDPLTGRDVGIPVVLPSSFTGGPRDRGQRHQDALAIVRHGKKPDVFITMTCNPKWPEITAALAASGAQPVDRPDIVGRVFRQKHRRMLRMLDDMWVLGRPRCRLGAIEWQFRGEHHHISCNSVVPCLLAPCVVGSADHIWTTFTKTF